MTRKILLDSNVLIGAFDGDAGNPAHEESKRNLRELLQDPEVKFAITPLIRYEVLRGAKNVSIDDLERVLNDFQEFEVRGAEARRAAEIYRLARQEGVNVSKRSFDIFHFVCAETNGLEMVSQDGDIQKIKRLVQAGQENA